MSNAPLTVTLHGHHVRRHLVQIANAYALGFIESTATVRHAPLVTAEKAAAWRATRATLESCWPHGELPPVPEPLWRKRYLGSDWVTTKFKDVTVAGLRMRHVLKQKLRPGAKEIATYDEDTARAAARLWADEFCKLMGVE